MSVRIFSKSKLGLSALQVVAWLLWGCAGGTTSDLEPARNFEREVLALCEVMPFGDPLYPALLSALSEGRTRFEPARAEACLDRLRSHSCPPDDPKESVGLGLGLALPGLCREAYAGTVGVGQPCETDVECEGDASCKGDMGASCQPRSSPGSACYSFRHCSVAPEEVPGCIPKASGGSECVARSAP